MKEVILEAQLREVSTKHNLKSLRNSGMIPAAFYGHNEKPAAIVVDAKKFAEVMHGSGGNVLINLKFDGQSKTAIVKEIQRDMISQKIVHLDLQAVSLQDKIEISVPLHILGIAPGVKLGGGVMEHILREVKISCLPTNIPQAINVDISALEINHAIAVKDLPKIEGIDFVSDPSSIIVNIVAPTILEEAPAPGTEAAAATATGAEPEVITKGKKPEEGAEGAAPAGGAAAPAKGAAPKTEKK